MRFLPDLTWRPFLAWLAPLSLLSSSLPVAHAASGNSTRESEIALALGEACSPKCSAGPTVYAPPYWCGEALWMGTRHGSGAGKWPRVPTACVVQLVRAARYCIAYH